MEKSFNNVLTNLVEELKFEGVFSRSGNVFYFDTEKTFNEVFDRFIWRGWIPLRSYREKVDKQGKETVTVREMKYTKEVIVHVTLTQSKQGISGIIKQPKIVYDFELQCFNNLQRRPIMSKYSVEDRIVVNMGSKKKPSYFLAEIVKAKNDKFKVEFDDGDAETVELEAIVGMGINKKYKKEIDPEYLDDYLQEEEEQPAKKSKKVVEDDEPPKKSKKPVEEEEPDNTSVMKIISGLKKSLKTMIAEVEAIKEANDILIEKMSLLIESLETDGEAPSKKTKPEEDEEDEPKKEEDDNWLDEE